MYILVGLAFTKYASTMLTFRYSTLETWIMFRGFTIYIKLFYDNMLLKVVLIGIHLYQYNFAFV